MRLGTALKIIVLVAATLVVGAIALFKSIDVNRYRAFAADQVQRATGRQLEIGGRFDLNWSLTPALVAEDVVFANIAGGSRPEMMKVRRVEAEIGLLPLLTGTVEIRRLVLVEPDLLLETDATGRANWPFGEGVDDLAGGASDTARTALRIGKVRLNKAQIVWRDRRDGRLVVARLDSLVADGTSPASPIAITASGTMDGHAMDLSGVVGSLAEVLHQTKPFPIKLKASTQGLVAMVDGSVARLAEFDGLDMKVTVEGTEAADVARMVGVEMPPLGPFRVAGRMRASGDQTSIAELDLAVGRRDLMLVTAKGSLGSLNPLKGVDLAVGAEADKPAALSSLADASLPAAAPLKLSGQLTDDDGAYRLRAVKGTVGRTDVAGEASLVLASTRPILSLQLVSALLDVADLDADLARPARNEKPPGEAVDGTVTQVVPPVRPLATGASPGDRVIPDLRLPVDGLRRADLRLRWTAKKLVWNDATAEDLDATVDITDGRLMLKPVTAKVADGRLDVEAVIDGRAKPAVFSAKVAGERIEAGPLLRALRLTEAISGGRTDFRAEVKGRGEGLREVMAQLDGEGVAVVGRAVVNNTYADWLAFDLLRQLAPWAPKESTTQVQCLVSRFTISNGLATSRALLFDTSNLTMGGDGTVNLASEGLDLRLAPRAKQASLVSLAVPMEVSGTFANPSILPNKMALAMGVVGAAAGAAIMPLAVLVPLITTGTGDANPCVEALAQANVKKPVAPSRKGQPGAIIDGIGEGIGGLLKGLTGR